MGGFTFGPEKWSSKNPQVGCPAPVPLCDDVSIRTRHTNKSRRSWTELAGSSVVNTDQRADGADGKNSQQGHGNQPSQQRGRAPQDPIYLRTFKYFLTALHSCNLAAPRQQAAGLGSHTAGGARKHARIALHANQPLLQSQFQLIYFSPPSHFFLVWFLWMRSLRNIYHFFYRRLHSVKWRCESCGWAGSI